MKTFTFVSASTAKLDVLIKKRVVKIKERLVDLHCMYLHRGTFESFIDKSIYTMI